MRASKSPLLFLVAHLQPIFDQAYAVIDDDVLLECGTHLQKALVLFLGAEAHHMFHAGTVVPAAIEDHDFSGRGKMSEVTLYVDLGLLAVGGRRQRYEPEGARADALGQGADRSALAGSVAAFEDDDDPLAGRLDPVLQGAELGLQLA